MPLSELPPPNVTEPGSSAPSIRVKPPGPLSAAWIARLERAESLAFGARRKTRSEISGADMMPIVLSSGQGSNLLDIDGNLYVDLAAGFGAMLLGHRSARLTRALEMQADRLWMGLGDIFPSDAKIALLEKLAALYPQKGARVLLGQSGSDAVTAALKTAKLATGKPGVIAFQGAYHGLDFAPLACCGLRASWRDAFADELNPHVAFAPYPASPADAELALDAVTRALASGNIGAVLIEPILGRGGCVVPPKGFLSELYGAARRSGALLIADEIWTGLGRAGHWLVSHAFGITPDLVCLGKGLGGGLPLSACIGSEEVMRCWDRGGSEEVVHTATFHGAPLACTTAIATLDALRAGKLDVRACDLGSRVVSELSRALADVPGVRVRGAGLMIGIAFDTGQTALVIQRKLLEAGYIVTSGGLRGEVIIITPPLNIADSLVLNFAPVLRGLLEG